MAILAPAILAAGAGSAAAEAPSEARVVVAMVPIGTTVEEIGAVEGISPGVVSAGMGAVDAVQTYLDISQGNRVNPSLYDDPPPLILIRDGRVPRRLWQAARERAAAAPANLVPGLLHEALSDAGVTVGAAPDEDGLWSLIAVDRTGRAPVVDPGRCGERGCGPGLSVVGAEVDELPAMAAALEPRDLLIVLTAAPPADRRLLPAGIAGQGFDGNLTSDSTRAEGLVISSDLAPTILKRLGVAIPGAMNGTAIRSEGQPDAASVADYQEQLVTRPGREAVVLVPLLIWLALAGIAALLAAAPAARIALPLFALACAWAPTLLLLAAAFDPGTVVLALILGLGAPALAAATAAALPGYRGLALACAVTVASHAVDVIAGSPLIAHSVLGPNPSGGVRFFGIGNEHAATLVPLAMIGAGAWLSTRDVSRRTAAWSFLALAVVLGVAYAPGAFGASVGTAIMLATGGAAAAALTLGMSGRRVLVVIAGAIVAGLAVLAAIDLAAGNAHLTRTVLGADEASELLDAFERRIRLMVDTFTSPVWPQLFGATVVLLIVGLVHGSAIASWFGRCEPARAGFLGALAAILVGSVANDSGSVLLVIGTIYLAASAGFFWGVRPPRAEREAGTDPLPSSR